MSWMLTESAVLLALVELSEHRRDIFGLAPTARSTQTHVRAIAVTLASVTFCKRALIATYGTLSSDVYHRWASEPHDGKLLSELLAESASMFSILEAAEQRIVHVPSERELLIVLRALKTIDRVERELDAMHTVIAVIGVTDVAPEIATSTREGEHAHD